MAATKCALVLLGLVVATFCVAAEATSRCGGCNPGNPVGGVGVVIDANLALKLDLHRCTSAAKVLVHGAVTAAAGVKAKAVECAAGVVTELEPVLVHLGAGGVAVVELQVLGYSKPLEASVVLDLAKVARVLEGVHYVTLEVVEDVKAKAVVVSCMGLHLYTFSLLHRGLGLGL